MTPLPKKPQAVKCPNCQSGMEDNDIGLYCTNCDHKIPIEAMEISEPYIQFRIGTAIAEAVKKEREATKGFINLQKRHHLTEYQRGDEMASERNMALDILLSNLED